MHKTRVYIYLAILSFLAFVAIAFVTKSAPFHSNENHINDIQRHLDSKQNQIKKIYQSLQSKSNDHIAEEISAMEDQAMKIFVFGEDQKMKVWSDNILPRQENKDWWIENDNARICFKIIEEGSTVIGCEQLDPNRYGQSLNSTEAIHALSHTNVFFESIKLLFYILFSLFSFLLLKTIFRNRNFLIFGFSALTLTGILVYFSEQLFDSFNVFNSAHYSNALSLSPGTLFLSSFFILFICISFSKQKFEGTSARNLPFYFIIPSLLFALILKGLEQLFQEDSKVQFENLSFDSLSIWAYSLGAIILLYAVHLVFQTFAQYINRSHELNRYYVLGTILISYLAFHFLLSISIPWYVMLLYLIIYYFSLELNSESLSSKLIWSIWFLILNAGLLSSVLYFYTIKKEIRQSQDYLSTLYKVHTTKEITQLEELYDEILSSKAYENIRAVQGDVKFSEIDLITYLDPILSNYKELELENIYLYDQDGDSRIINEEKIKSQVLEHYFNTASKSRNIVYNPVSQKLLFDYSAAKGGMLISLSETGPLKKIKEIDYGLFKDGAYISGTLKSLPKLDTENIKNENVLNVDAVSHIFHKVDDQNILYARKTYSSLLKPISLFSFIFCLSGIFVFLINLMSLKFELFRSPFLNFASFGSLSTRIQMVIIFLILISFLSIAIVTSLYFQQVLKNNQEKNISAKVISINNSLQNRLASIADMQSAINLIENELPNISANNNVSAEFYLKDGRNTFGTSTNKVYPFYPYYQHRAHSKKDSYTIQSKNIVSAYFPLTHSVLGSIGYISLDDKSFSGDSVKSSISEFLSSMLNLYVFLFFIAGALAIAMSKSITRPLTALQLRLKSIKFGSKNEIIEWEANDEIGELITSYNDMLVKLEQNLELLAKTERDTAWREMAKQVAHEIKNPLTPMKLSIQYLKRAIQSDPQNSEAIVDKISNTLVEQIDNLAEIANAFSNFATLPQANNDKINLNEVVEVVHDLFRKRDDMDIKLFEPLNAIEVFADKNHMIRILNNLVKNAIQSIPEERKGVISISLYKENDKAVIKVEDNGKGIPEDLQKKVFTPYFTTKTSGTGLGLAISANMLNAFDGHIYFETSVGTGTSFFIEIPLMRETYKYQTGEKLLLD